MKIASPDLKISKELVSIANQLDDKLREVAGERMGFSLVVFQSELGSRMNYMSNCERGNVRHALTSLLKGWDEGMPDIPRS